MKIPSISKFLRSLFRFFQRPEVVPMTVEIVRQARCNACPHNEHMQCVKCTCFIPLKVKMATEFCPDGRWNEYFTPRKNGIK